MVSGLGIAVFGVTSQVNGFLVEKLMAYGMDSLYVFMVSCAVCVCLIPVAVALANRFNLLDHPTGRKQHAEPTPLVGGVVIYFAWAISTLLFYGSGQNISFLFWMSIVLAVGVLDDYLDLSKRVRVLTHCLVVVGIWVSDGLMVESIGVIFGGTEPVVFSLLVGLIFTAIAVIGAVNAVNMIDGVDGLLGSLLFISIFTLLVVSELSSQASNTDIVFSSMVIASILGAVLAFLMLNARVFGRASAKIYMGDAGSTFLGFMLVYLMIDFSQSDTPLIGPVAAGWILGLPLLDASAVIARRVIERRSPMDAGRDHLHHFLMSRGFDVNSTICIMVAIHISMVAIALTVERSGFVHSDLFLFWGFIGLVVFRLVITSNWNVASVPPEQPDMQSVIRSPRVTSLMTSNAIDKTHHKDTEVA